MGDATKISWTDATWNPIRGCRRTAPEGSKQSGCGDPTGGGCYAERQAARFCGPGQAYEGLITLTAKGPRWSGKTRTVPEHLRDPLRWRRPRRIFTDSMSDLFYEGFSDYDIDRVVAVMIISSTHEFSPGHIFQTLTKRPERMRHYFADPRTQERVADVAGNMMEDGDAWSDGIRFRKAGLLHPNMWWGTSVENQAAANERIPQLLATTAAVRFISAEPLLGLVELDKIETVNRTTGLTERMNELEHVIGIGVDRPALDWVIVGCESGPRARHCDVEWLREIRDATRRYHVPLFLKQQTYETDIQIGDGSFTKGRGFNGAHVVELPYLDGVQYAQFPETAHLEAAFGGP